MFNTTAVTTIPGPKSSPIRGNLPQFQKDPLRLLTQAAQEHGDIVRLRLGPRTVYLLSHPDYIEEVLVKQKGVTKVKTANFSPVAGNGLLRSEGEFHMRQRRLAQPGFHLKRIAGYTEVMARHTQAMLQTWQDGEVRDLHEEMMHLTLLIVAQTLFNADLTHDTHTIGEALNELLLGMNQRMNYPILATITANWPLPSNRRFEKALADMDNIVYRIIGERRAGGEDVGDLLSMLLLAQDEEGTGSMSDEQLRDEVITLLLAGHETTANALSWTWYLLAQHPEVRAKLEAELAQVLNGRFPTFADLPNLPYTDQIIQESMRLYPPAWLQGRQLNQAITFGNHTLPENSIVFFSQYVMHRHPAYWENPNAFQPERFAPENAQSRPRFAYFPFGAGTRQCIGKSFALMEAQLILAGIAQSYRLDLQGHQPITPQPLITLRPKEGIPMVLHQR